MESGYDHIDPAALQITGCSTRMGHTETVPGILSADGTDQAGGMVSDVMDLILADHRRIRRLQGALRDLARSGDDADVRWRLAPLWQRLADLLEAHCAVEEEICHPAIFGSGPQATAGTLEAVADHDDIREAIMEAHLEPIGSAGWWRAVRATLVISTQHMDAEERGILADCNHRWSASQRQKLGLEWSKFIAARLRDAAPPADHPASRSSGTTVSTQHGPAPETAQ